MGMVDTLTCELEMPGVPNGVYFQTKDLFCYGGHLVITQERRLVEEIRYRDPASRRDLEYHGDIRLCGEDADRRPLEYVARFTHGQLEWFRAASELPESYLCMLRIKG